MPPSSDNNKELEEMEEEAEEERDDKEDEVKPLPTGPMQAALLSTLEMARKEEHT
jgi:hypothetical protein